MRRKCLTLIIHRAVYHSFPIFFADEIARDTAEKGITKAKFGIAQRREKLGTKKLRRGKIEVVLMHKLSPPSTPKGANASPQKLD